MAKEEIFMKLKRKDYNNELEKVLENKAFSESTKNLLLSMFYKIENAYADYQTVKQEVPEEKDFLENLIRIIAQECEEIELIEPKVDENNEIKVDTKEKKITVYPNEKKLLDAILQLEKNRICFSDKNTILSNALCEFTKLGNDMNKSEVIRDFNGWSWDISKLEIGHIPYNLLYQNVMLLLGEEFMSQWLKNEFSEIESTKILEKKLEQKYQKDAEIFYPILYKTVILFYAEQHPEEKVKVIQQLEMKRRQLQLLENKKELLEEVTKNKRELHKKIGEIDKVLNDNDLIREEYRRRNAKLPNKDKIFSISHLADSLEKERKEYLASIEEYNRMLEPKEYVETKNKIKDEIHFLEELELEKQEVQMETILQQVQKAFLICMGVAIQHCQTKKDVVHWIYVLRYYQLLPFSETTEIRQVEQIQEMLENVQKELLEKAKQYKVIAELEVEEKLEYEIWKKLLQTKIICLEKISIKMKQRGQEIQIECYDDDVVQEEWNLTIPDLSDKVKRSKKIRLILS